MEEIWKDISGYGGDYQVSNLGRVKTSRFNKSKIMSFSLRGNYLKVDICKNKKVKSLSVHRLVCGEFVSNIDFKPNVNHKNGIKTDNRSSNLEWVTHSENVKHSYQTLGASAKHRWIPIAQYTLDGGFIKNWNSFSEASKTLKIERTGISQCCSGKRKTAGGFGWKYLN